MTSQNQRKHEKVVWQALLATPDTSAAEPFHIAARQAVTKGICVFLAFLITANFIICWFRNV